MLLFLRLMKPLTVFTLIVGVFSCSEPQQTATQAPAPAVSVYSVNAEAIGQYREFVARTQASREVNLKARVEGELIERYFDEGATVKAKQKLFKIDPSEYEASLASVKADLKSQTAFANRAERDLKRGLEIAKDGYISSSDLDKLRTNAEQSEAAVKVAKAALEKAELSLSYTEILAPYSGRIGKVNYNVGNIVGPNSEPLASLMATDPIYVNFQVEEADFISYRQQHKEVDSIEQLKMQISLRLPNNTKYQHLGSFKFSDTQIQQGMGTVEIRTSFPNPEGIVLPGLYVTLITESEAKENKVLIPQVAVQENQQGKFVLVVKDNKVTQRLIILGRRINAMWVVEKGLEKGEQIIIEGLQKVRPGIAVTPVEKSVDALTGVISTPAVSS